MSIVDVLTQQTKDSYNWVNKLIKPISYDRWDETPVGIDSNISWQIGHLLMSWYYHSVMVIAGHNSQAMKSVPFREYDGLYSSQSPKDSVGKTDPKELQSHSLIIQNLSLDTIANLSDSDLDSDLEPTRFKHPVANNKQQALEWNIQHTMWHCGQIGMIKRVVDTRMDFGQDNI